MAQDDATLTAAPAPDAGQPATQAVPSVPVSPAPDVTAEAPAADAAATAAPSIPERLWAGKFKAPEVLEESYQHLQAEASRMAQRLAALEKQTTPAQTQPTAQPATYTPEQLETTKVALLQKQAKAMAQGDEDQAATYAGNIVWIDRELRKADMNVFSQRQTAQTAYTSLAQEVQPILEQFKDELQPGTPVYQKADAFYRQAVAAGAPANEITATSAAVLALLKSGKVNQDVTLKAAQHATQALNQSLKTAAVAGGGGANTGRSATPDLAALDVSTPAGRAAFEEVRHKLGVSGRR